MRFEGSEDTSKNFVRMIIQTKPSKPWPDKGRELKKNFKKSAKTEALTGIP